MHESGIGLKRQTAPACLTVAFSRRGEISGQDSWQSSSGGERNSYLAEVHEVEAPAALNASDGLLPLPPALYGLARPLVTRSVRAEEMEPQRAPCPPFHGHKLQSSVIRRTP